MALLSENTVSNNHSGVTGYCFFGRAANNCDSFTLLRLAECQHKSRHPALTLVAVLGAALPHRAPPLPQHTTSFLGLHLAVNHSKAL